MATRRDRRQRGRHQRTGAVLGIVAALLGALLVYQLLLRGDDGPTTATPADRPAAAASVDSPATTTTVPQEPTLPNGSFAELSLRDPFEPVSYSSGGGSSSSTTTTTTTTPSGTLPTTPTTTPAQNPSGAQEIQVLDVTIVNGTQTARVEVNGSQYTVTVGQVFATNYQLVVFTSAECADFRHADATFNLCAGQQSNK